MFWMLVAALSLLAVAFVAVPLLRRQRGAEGAVGADQANAGLYAAEIDELKRLQDRGEISAVRYDEARAELERRLLDDVGAAPGAGPAAAVHVRRYALLALLVPLLAWPLYQYLGRGAEYELAARVDQMQQRIARGAASSSDQMALLGELVSYTRRHAEPEWLFMQGQLALQMGAYQVAADSYASLSERDPLNAEYISHHAQALYLARGRKSDPEIDALMDRALEVNPHQPRVLGIRGMAAFQAGDYATAIATWQQALMGLPQGSPAAEVLRQGVMQARAAMGEPAAAPVAPFLAAHGAAPTPSDAVVTGFDNGIRVRVVLDDAASVVPGATVFVIASAPAGGMPFAVARLPVEKLPTEVVLDDTSAMMQGRALSQQAEVRVTARVSASGNALASRGDWQGQSAVMTPDSAPPVVDIHIDQQVL